MLPEEFRRAVRKTCPRPRIAIGPHAVLQELLCRKKPETQGPQGTADVPPHGRRELIYAIVPVLANVQPGVCRMRVVRR